MREIAHSYYAVFYKYGRGIEANVDPEQTRRDIIDRIRSGEYQRDRIAFIHHVVMGELPQDVTEELIEAAERLLQAAE